MKFRHNGQTLTGTAEEILQKIKDRAPKEYEVRYDGVTYIGTELEIKREIARVLRYVDMVVKGNKIFLREEEAIFHSNVIRTSLVSQALARVELYCLDPRNET